MRNFSLSASIILIASVWLMLCSFTPYSDADLFSAGVSEEDLKTLKEDVIEGQTGVIMLSACHAQIEVPEGFLFLDEPQARKLLIDYWDNPESNFDDLLGVLVPDDNEYFLQISVAFVITYDNCGYIKDNDANSIDYNELLETLQKDFEENNKSLPEGNRCKLKGWTVTPHYDQSNHVLIWAKTLEFSSGEVVNYDMRILGKDGLVSINAVVNPEDVEEVVSKESTMVQSFRFDKGYAYADFNPARDKVSDWTLGGLVAGSILAKTGVLSKLGLLLLKFWKIIAVGAVGLVAGIKKLLGSKKPKE